MHNYLCIFRLLGFWCSLFALCTFYFVCILLCPVLLFLVYRVYDSHNK